MTVQLTQEKKFSKQDINSLHKDFQTYGKNARGWIQKCKMLLPQIKEHEVWKQKGFISIYEYARVLAGMSTHAVDDALWVMKKLENKPKLQKIAEEKGLNAVRPVLTVSTEGNEKFWAKKAAKMSQNTLKTYVKECRDKGLVLEEKVGCEEPRVNPGQNVVGQSKSKSIYMKLDVKTIERLKKIKGERDWDELLSDILDMVEGCEVENNEDEAGKKPCSVNTGKRYIPAKIKKHVIAKTSGCCAYPGCTKQYEILHHTKRFALDSTHDPDALVPLCKSHERIAHGGLIEGEEEVPVKVVRDSDGNGDEDVMQINWCVRKQPDTTNSKHQIDHAVQKYYMRQY